MGMKGLIKMPKSFLVDIQMETGTTIKGLPTPTTNDSAANKQYVDNAVAGVSGGGYQALFIQQTEPNKVNGQPWSWYQTDADGDLVNLFVFDGVL